MLIFDSWLYYTGYGTRKQDFGAKIFYLDSVEEGTQYLF